MSVRLCVLIVTFRMEFMEVQGQVGVYMAIEICADVACEGCYIAYI